MVKLVDHMRLGRSEAAGECDILGRRQRLLTQYQHLAAEEGLFEFGEFRVGQRPRSIDGGGLQAETRRKRFRVKNDGIVPNSSFLRKRGLIVFRSNDTGSRGLACARPG